MFVRFRETNKFNKVNGRPIYEGDLLHNGEKYEFEDYTPSFSTYDKNSWRSQREAMKQEVVEYFENSKQNFKKIR